MKENLLLLKDLLFINPSMYTGFNKENNKEALKFKVGDNVRISKYKNIFGKGYIPNWSGEVFVIKKVKNTVPWAYAVSDFNGEEIVGTIDEKQLQKTSQKDFRVEKIIKRKGYDSSFNSWNDKKDII